MSFAVNQAAAHKRGMNTGPIVVLDDAKAQRLRVFDEPQAILQATTPAEVAPALAAMQAALAAGNHLAGYFSYELGYVLESRLTPLLPEVRPVPLLWFAVFTQPPQVLEGAAADAFWADGRAWAGPLTPEWDEQAYADRFERSIERIVAGDIYQINLSLRAQFRVVGSARALHRELRAHSGAAHGAFIHDGKREILSFSPELFFNINQNGGICTRPMKGTAARGHDGEADAALRAGLAASQKNRAENLMIVDLLRNDLSRIAKIGSVAVPSLFEIETYPTVHQMVSSVSAHLQRDTTVERILRALFPCGSVTGAPKIRAMEIIHELEASPRGVYCGAIGHFAPDGSAEFSVAIRTLTLNNGCGELGIGGAIVADSDMASEYAECLLKARHYDTARCPLVLIETLRYEWGAFVRDALHMQRMRASARHFGIAFDQAAAAAMLAEAVAEHDGPLRVRLTLAETGHFAVSTAALGAAPNVWRYVISPVRLASDDALLRHKTSWRGVHDAELARLKAQLGCDEVLLLNENNQLCEGSRSNLFVEIDGTLLTPALGSGLLDGCLRQEMLARGQCREAVLTLPDLDRANRLYLGNSLRGLIPAVAVASVR